VRAPALLLGVLAFMGAAPVANAGPNAQGVVQHLLSRQPIAGARVQLECKKARFFHGSDTLRVVETSSGADGRFAFSAADLGGCSFVLVAPSKNGFRDAMLIPYSAVRPSFEVSAAVPQVLYMVKDSEVAQLQLDGLLQESRAAETSPMPQHPEADYSFVNARFFESLRVAATPAHAQWVRLAYCDRLRALWAKVPPPEQQRHLAGKFSNIVPFPEVAAYCAGEGQR
jgi:hypothetical protein